MKKLTSIILASLMVLGVATMCAQDANNTPNDKLVVPEIQRGADVKGPAPQRGWEQRQPGPMNRGEFRGGPWGQGRPMFAQGPRQGGSKGPVVGQSSRGGKGKCQCPCHEKQGKGKRHGKSYGPRHSSGRE